MSVKFINAIALNIRSNVTNDLIHTTRVCIGDSLTITENHERKLLSKAYDDLASLNICRNDVLFEFI